MLTGRHPFGQIPINKAAGETALLLLERQEAGCTPLRSLNPQVDRSLATLIESCLAFEVKNRPISAAAFATALQRRFAPSRRARVLLCSLGVLLLASGGVLAYSPLIAPHLSTQAPRSAEAEYKAGCEAFEAGNYDVADACFDRALKASPNDERYLFASGRTLLALNNAGSADHAFAKALEMRPKDPDVLAALAYSELLNKQLASSFTTSRDAVTAGFPLTPAFCTNRAHAWRHMKRDDKKDFSEKDFDAVRDELNSALKTKPDYLPALYYRAMFAYDHWLLNRQTKENLVISDQAVADIETVLNHESPKGEFAQLNLEAAHIYAATRKRTNSAKVEGQLRIAVLRGGMQKKRFNNDPVLPLVFNSYNYQQFFTSLPDHPDTSTPLPRELVTPNPIEGWLE